MDSRGRRRRRRPLATNLARRGERRRPGSFPRDPRGTIRTTRTRTAISRRRDVDDTIRTTRTRTAMTKATAISPPRRGARHDTDDEGDQDLSPPRRGARHDTDDEGDQDLSLPDEERGTTRTKKATRISATRISRRPVAARDTLRTRIYHLPGAARGGFRRRSLAAPSPSSGRAYHDGRYVHGSRGCLRGGSRGC